jgi:LmbE family N-acetylglucosaminyl deacetylase
MPIFAGPVLETDVIPYHSLPPPGENVLILAPHPDDETLGCGGTIRLLIGSKKKVKILFLTSGDKANIGSLNPSLKKGEEISSGQTNVTEYALLREKEAEKALKILGVSDYEFLRFPDRELHKNYKTVLDTMLRIIEGYKPDTIFSPSMVELNPDHRTTAGIAMELQRMRPALKIVFYEITTPLRPNILVDITSVYKRKKRAIKKYKSQLKLTDYLVHITALNTIRSLTLNKVQHVEAFWFTDIPLSDEGITKWLSYIQTINTKS